MLALSFYIKHQFSCLSDVTFKVSVAEVKKLVTITSDVFDSSLMSWLIKDVLPRENNICVYRSDDAGWTPPYPPYALQIRIGGDDGPLFDAQAVALSSALSKDGKSEMAITLSIPRTEDEIRRRNEEFRKRMAEIKASENPSAQP